MANTMFALREDYRHNVTRHIKEHEFDVNILFTMPKCIICDV